MSRPTHKIFFVANTPTPKEGEEKKKAFWHEIGAAWTNNDGSLNLKFELIPATMASGTIQARVIEDKKE